MEVFASGRLFGEHLKFRANSLLTEEKTENLGTRNEVSHFLE